MDDIAISEIDSAAIPPGISIPNYSVFRAACRVAGCRVTCRVIDISYPQSRTPTIAIESSDDESGLGQCIKYPPAD